MKIRTLLAALLLTLVIGACGQSATGPTLAPEGAQLDGEAPPPDTTGRGGGPAGSGN